jgi:hypothetical protein
MKKLIILIMGVLFCAHTFAQSIIKDDAVDNQEQRMVFQQWDQDKFYPKPGFLSLNPYYWLVWGLFYPNYHKTDIRPLGPTGPQTQRLALVGVQNTEDNKYKLHADTVRNTALSQIASQSGLLSDADPLWLLYYKSEFSSLNSYSLATILGPLTPQVSAELIKDGLYSWYSGELASLKGRLDGARSTDMDRGSRIIAYYRLLKEYRTLNGVWNIRIASAASTLAMTKQQQQVKTGATQVPNWSSNTDVQIAAKVLQNANY